MKNEKGQILLITVMLLATVMTVVLSISFKSVTETQVTKLEEESQKALSAAESAIEVALKKNSEDGSTSIALSSISGLSGFTGNAFIDSTASKTFTTPSIPKDGSYTFYLGDYNPSTKEISNSTDEDITLCFESGTTNPAIEITLVKLSGVKKYVIDDPLSSRIDNASNALTIACSNGYNFSTVIPGIDIGDDDGQFLLVRVFYAPTKLFFSRSTNLLPLQGRTISSQATSSTSTGVSKKVVLFQSNPQIPADFFTTSF